MFDGDLEKGELGIGQVLALVDKIEPAGDIVRQMWQEFLAARQAFCLENPPA